MACGRSRQLCVGSSWISLCCHKVCNSFLQIGNLIGNPIENINLAFFFVDFSSRKLKYFKFSASPLVFWPVTFIRGEALVWSALVWATQSVSQVFLFVVFFRPVSFSSVVAAVFVLATVVGN